MRLIDADALDFEFDRRCFSEEDENYVRGVDEAIGVVENAPTIDAVPVVHGRWDNIPNTYTLVASKDGSYSGNATTCSVCHEVNPSAYKTNYCPNCGAKMDLEEQP